MIKVMSVKEIKGNVSNFDEVWFVVRSLKKLPAGCKQVKALAPSEKLFVKYLNTKAAGKWGKRAFESGYVPCFIEQMQKDINARKALNYLYSMDKKGKNICLVCFCEEESLCHRSILAGLLQGAGVNVEVKNNTDYSKYFKLYKGEE